uniref:Uncharacterized protein n=1 Tax=Arundo donax TaxID=35708 RepID=A0A0A8YLU3_ARUDO
MSSYFEISPQPYM